jgi:hypothetical protein
MHKVVPLHQRPNQAPQHSEYESMSLQDLANELGKAEHAQKPIVNEISDVLLEKMIAAESQLLQRSRNKIDSHLSDTEWNNVQSDALWDTVLGVADARREELARVEHTGPAVSADSWQKIVHKKERQNKLQGLVTALGGVLKLREAEHSQEPIAFELNISQKSRPERGARIQEDVIISRKDLGLIGIFHKIKGRRRLRNASRIAAEAVEIQYESYLDEPRSTDEALDRAKAAMQAARESVQKEVGEADDEQATTASFIKTETINGRPYAAWANAGDSRSFIQKRRGEPIEAISTDQSDAGHVQNVLSSDSEYKPSVEDEYGVVPLDLNTRLLICTNSVTTGVGGIFSENATVKDIFSNRIPQSVTGPLMRLDMNPASKAVIAVDVVAPGTLASKSLPARKGNLQASSWSQYSNASFRQERKEQHIRKRRRVAAFAAGALAVAGVVVALIVGTRDSSQEVAPPNFKSPPTAQTEKPNLQPPSVRQGMRDIQPPRESARQARAERTLSLAESGTLTTIWGGVERYLRTHNYTTNVYTIDQVKDSVLQHQGLTESAATMLPVGYTFTIPRSVLRAIPKK